jgi:hypothetical protein
MHHYVPFLSIMCQCMLSRKKNACCRESRLSYPSTVLLLYVNHNLCMHHVSYRGRTVSPAVFYERPTSSQGVAVDGGAHCASNQVGQQFSNTMFPPSRERQLLISPHPTPSLQTWFFRHVRHYKHSFSVLVIFLDICVPHIHFAIYNNI